MSQLDLYHMIRNLDFNHHSYDTCLIKCVIISYDTTNIKHENLYIFY